MVPAQSALQRKLARGNIVYNGGTSAPNNQVGDQVTQKLPSSMQAAIKRRAGQSAIARKVK